MQDEIFKKMTETCKSSHATMQEFSEINNKLLKEIAELQMSLATYSIDSSIELTKVLTSKTNYKEVMSAEAEHINEYGSKMLEFSRKTVGLLNETRDEMVVLFENVIENNVVEAKPKPKRNSRKVA